jgi:DHA2 family multidrug resistance protein
MATNHAYLTESITSERLGVGASQFPQAALENAGGLLLMLDAEVTRQAATIAYINDFKLMMWVVLAASPLILLLRKRAPASSPA